jgi:hypothetical protein
MFKGSHDLGNFIDTANNYQDEESEKWIGEWMAARKNRDQLVNMRRLLIKMWFFVLIAVGHCYKIHNGTPCLGAGQGT